MNAIALGGGFREQEPALGPAFALSALVHIVLVAVLFLGVRWQSHPPETVSVDLVDALPPPPVRVVEPPKPPPPTPKVAPEVVKPPPPAPPISKPDIALREKPKPKPKPEPKKAEVKPEPKPKPKAVAKPKPDPELQKRMNEQIALEQKALDQQRQERALRDILAAEQANAAKAAAAARAKALNEYVARIQAKVKGNWILPAELQGNPEAVFLVVQLPTGEVLSTRLLKSSGNAAYDTAVERAILKSSPLPLPAAREDFSRELKLTFRPKDK
jgi:colicin import membrane protein